MSNFPIRAAFLSLLLATACAVDVGDTTSPGPNTTGNGDGNGGGNGDGSGGGNGNGACSLASLSNAEHLGFFFEGDEPEVFVDVHVEDGGDFDSLSVSMFTAQGTAPMGPGSYELTEDRSLDSCNPCVLAHKGTPEEVTFVAVATSGTLRVDTVDARDGGRFAGEVSGLELVEIDESGEPTSCLLSVPTLSFDVTLEAI